MLTVAERVLRAEGFSGCLHESGPIRRQIHRIGLYHVAIPELIHDGGRFTLHTLCGKVLTSAKSIEVLGAGMKTVQALIPPKSKLAIDSSTATGKVLSIGWNATLEAIESMGDPAAIAKQVMKDSRAAILPSADITPEEINILREQNLENNLIDEVIADLEGEIAENEKWLSSSSQIIADLEAEAVKWSASEKERVLFMLEDECEE